MAWINTRAFAAGSQATMWIQQAYWSKTPNHLPWLMAWKGSNLSLIFSVQTNLKYASLLVEVRDVAHAFLHGLLLIQEQYELGDGEGAAAVLKSAVGNAEYFVKATRGMTKRSNKGLGILESSSLDDASPYNLEEISNARLAEFLQPQVIDEQIQIV